MTRKQNHRIAHYFIGLYLILVLILCKNLYRLFSLEGAESAVGPFYGVVAVACYAFLYLVPGLATVKLFQGLLRKMPGIGTRSEGRSSAVAIGAVMVPVGWLTLLVIYADSELFSLYAYHFDGFVWNLIITPGGIASLGATAKTHVAFGMIALVFFIVAAGLYWLAGRVVETQWRPLFFPRFSLFMAFAVLFALTLLQEAFYGVSSLYRKYEYTQASAALPFFLNTSFNSFAKSMGLNTGNDKMRIATGKIVYPLEPVQVVPPGKPLNVLWLTAESLRSDMLAPEIMPKTWAFSENALRFEDHYSGGNRTRMGLLSMFYGLYAPYWYAVQEQKIGPVLMDVLLEQKYQMSIHTSQSFSYPELYDTVFAKVPRQYMHELNKDPRAWKNDERNVTDILSFLDRRDPSKPFFAFMFFESTHAPYHFPEQAVLEEDYLEDMNYAKLNLVHNAARIKHRYINAAHFLDGEVARLLEYLQRDDLLDNTIVVFTGDHGEEFMEKGHWGHGHNAQFPEEQIRVPLVISLPGEKARSIQRMTSHLDIPATLLPHLGMTSPAEVYSLGRDLLAPDYARDNIVAGNYDYISLIDDSYKLTFPFKRYSDRVAARKKNDDLVTARERDALLKAYQPVLAEIIDEANLFTRRPLPAAAAKLAPQGG